jgi:hypothetical protein
MSFRVLHYEGTKELLFERLGSNANELKEEYKNDYEEGYFEGVVDAVVKKDLSDEETAAFILAKAIGTYFHSTSEDWKIKAYDDLAAKTSGKLKEILEMFVNGRNFITGSVGFGDEMKEMTCGYLDPDEVKEFLNILKDYHPDKEPEYEQEFVDSLTETFTTLSDKNAGDLFTMY